MFTNELSQSLWALGIAFALCAVLCPLLIPILRKLKFGQYIRKEGVESHQKKAGTPTMGGIAIVIALVISGLIFMNRNLDVAVILLVTAGYGIVGFLDDFLKIKHKDNLGLKAWQKLVGLFLITGLFIYYLVCIKEIGTEIMVPFMNGYMFNISWFYIPFCLLVMMATTNSVNMTDGLDGLATGVTILVMTFFGVVCYKMFPELTPCVCALIGALVGFLLYNAHPAKVFMGDTGSLALGGFLGAICLITKMPLFVIIVGLIYVMESLSVIIQVTSFKLTKKRVFKMAPIHHHFELCGWKETRVVDVFYIITAVCCLIGFLAL